MTTSIASLFPEAGMKYWDDFERRVHETVDAFNDDELPMLRRISVHITNACNFGCEYCNEVHFPKTLGFDSWAKMLGEYSVMGGGIVHVTGGEPTVVKNFQNYIRETGKYDNISFHLNTNLYSGIMTDELFPMIKRLKVSLDTTDAEYFNALVKRKNAYEVVTKNLDRVHEMIRNGETDTVVSLTYTVTKENYRNIPAFLEMYERRWPLFYACFFSSYKGTNTRFALDDADVDRLFTHIVPELDRITTEFGDTETNKLFHASHETRTFKKANRFPEVMDTPCFLQLSELVVDEDGNISNCSHLFRDNAPKTGLNLKDGTLNEVFKTAKTINQTMPIHAACLYGCNKKLTAFNGVVLQQLRKSI